MLPMPTMDTWKRVKQQGFMSSNSVEKAKFKVRIRSMKVSRWIVCSELPTELEYDEWLYVDEKGVPSMYWNAKMSGVFLI